MRQRVLLKELLALKFSSLERYFLTKSRKFILTDDEGSKTSEEDITGLLDQVEREFKPDQHPCLSDVLPRAFP